MHISIHSNKHHTCLYQRVQHTYMPIYRCLYIQTNAYIHNSIHPNKHQNTHAHTHLLAHGLARQTRKGILIYIPTCIYSYLYTHLCTYKQTYENIQTIDNYMSLTLYLVHSLCLSLNAHPLFSICSKKQIGEYEIEGDKVKQAPTHVHSLLFIRTASLFMHTPYSQACSK